MKHTVMTHNDGVVVLKQLILSSRRGNFKKSKAEQLWGCGLWTKFVCVSGLGRDEELQSRCRAAGMVPLYSLGKPFDRKELLDLLTKTFGHV